MVEILERKRIYRSPPTCVKLSDMIDRQDQFKASVHFTPIEQASGNTGNKCMPFSRLYYVVWTAFRFFQRKSLSLLFSYIKIHLTFFSTGAHRGTSLLWIEFDSHKGVIIAVCRIPFHVNISQTYSNVIRDAYAFAISLSLSHSLAIINEFHGVGF